VPSADLADERPHQLLVVQLLGQLVRGDKGLEKGDDGPAQSFGNWTLEAGNLEQKYDIVNFWQWRLGVAESSPPQEQKFPGLNT
jgi:hypothetical protein